MYTYIYIYIYVYVYGASRAAKGVERGHAAEADGRCSMYHIQDLRINCKQPECHVNILRFGWRYSSNATCLIRPHSFYV